MEKQFSDDLHQAPYQNYNSFAAFDEQTFNLGYMKTFPPEIIYLSPIKKKGSEGITYGQKVPVPPSHLTRLKFVSS